MNVISNFAARYERTREEEISLEDYLEICKNDKSAYATAAERMLDAIGEPQMVDTRNDPRLSRIFANKVIKIYPAFEEFYGMEEAIEQVEIQVKYEGYLERERDLASRISRLDHVPLDVDLDYLKLNSLSMEARQKLDRVRPTTLGQASRISGVSPADISVLLVYMGR